MPRRWPGSTVVCVGGGPSLTPEDVETCRGRVVGIAINDAYRLMPWAGALMASDAKWWRYHHGAPTCRGLKYCLDDRLTQDESDEWGVTRLEMSGREGLDADPSCLRSGKNSGAAAINLAVHLGATRILLLGYDMSPDRARTHWFGNHPAPLHTHSPYPAFREMFQTQVVPLAARGVEVLNCSRRTLLEAFPRCSLEEALCQS